MKIKLKSKLALYAAGLVIAFITFIPVIPRALQFILALIPILFFGTDLTLTYMKDFFAGKYISRYAAVIIAALGLIVTGKLSYAAIALIFYSAASYYFDKFTAESKKKIDSFNKIVPASVRLADGRKVPTDSIIPGTAIILRTGDVVPCDCSITAGEATVDYTNVFGSDSIRVLTVSAPCYSGGIVQSGALNVIARKRPAESLAALITQKTKAAHAPSPLQKKIKKICSVFELAMIALSLLLFIILLIATKDFPVSLNIVSVILIAFSAFGFTSSMPLLCHNAILSGRRRGIIFADVAALEQCGELSTVSFGEEVSEEVYARVEETGVIPATGGYARPDAVAYRDAAKLDSDMNPCFKLALGFFSKNADAAALDGKPERMAGAIRTAKHYKNAFRLNLLCIGIEKLTLIALAFLLNVSPVAAIVIEFVAWMVCAFNSTREI